MESADGGVAAAWPDLRSPRLRRLPRAGGKSRVGGGVDPKRGSFVGCDHGGRCGAMVLHRAARGKLPDLIGEIAGCLAALWCDHVGPWIGKLHLLAAVFVPMNLQEFDLLTGVKTSPGWTGSSRCRC